jgi:VanZ family protein
MQAGSAVFDRPTRISIIKAACICTLFIILLAGLWPFHVPKNEVTWLTHEDGLSFGHHGAIISGSSFLAQPDKASGSIELWLAPSLLRGAHTILSFDGSAHRGVPFSIRQLDDSLIVEQDNEDTNGNSWTAWSVVKGAFHARKPVFVSVILGPRHTAVYLNGFLYKDFAIGDSWNNFTGQLVIANSPNNSDSWSGTIRGMAIYNRRLMQGEIFGHYLSWTRVNRPTLIGEPAPIALYLFHERAGDIAHNEFDRRTDLKIPIRYFVLHPPFLESPSRSYHPSWSYWKDVTVNVVGFVPFGFLTTAYFSSVRHMKGAGWVAVALGFLTSLLIEILQGFLPTRNSGMNDLITNTLGTTTGAILYLYIARGNLSAARARELINKHPVEQNTGDQGGLGLCSLRDGEGFFRLGQESTHPASVVCGGNSARASELRGHV